MTLATSRRQPGKLKADRIGLRGTAMLPTECLRPEVGQVALWSVLRDENLSFAPASMPKATLHPLRCAFCCSPLLPRLSGQARGSKKRPEGRLLTA
jgi:hypothetical protein